MRIGGFQKLTLLDYPGYLACIVFTQGCNMRCPYCQNSQLLDFRFDSLISEDEVFEYLKKRQGILDGVVITGGEPTVQKNLKDFIIKVKNLGFLVKLDTNGTNPALIKELIDSKLIDYIAMDIKNSFINYKLLCGIDVQIDKIRKSVDLIKKSEIDHEFRTTIVKNRHDITDIIAICKLVGTNERLYLQNFQMSDGVVDRTLESFEDSELNIIQKMLSREYPNVSIRGLKIEKER